MLVKIEAETKVPNGNQFDGIPPLDYIVTKMGKICTGKEDRVIDLDMARRFMKTNVIGKGHDGLLEHYSWTFLIEDISRACANQLVRHRIASYAQLSMRYTQAFEYDHSIVTPPSIQNNPNALQLFQNAVDHSKSYYQSLITLGIKPEDARFIAPLGHKTNIAMTVNARSLLHIFQLRLAKEAQWEIKEIVWAILGLVYYTSPTLWWQFAEGELYGQQK